MTVEKLAWIVGFELGTMHESQEKWANKIMGPARNRRFCQARNLVMLAFYEFYGLSYNEIAEILNRRHESVIGRGISWARKWVAASLENEGAWQRIDVACKETVAAEKRHHAEVESIKVVTSK